MSANVPTPTGRHLWSDRGRLGLSALSRQLSLKPPGSRTCAPAASICTGGRLLAGVLCRRLRARVGYGRTRATTLHEASPRRAGPRGRRRWLPSTEGSRMDIRFWLIQIFNGVSYGALLFLVASGLSLIFGVMRIVNLSHGSYFLLGGYVALSVIWTTGSWALAIPVAALAIAVLGLLVERVFLRPLGSTPLRQVLLTVGFAVLFQQAALDIWGGNNLDIAPPAALTQSVNVGGLYFPLYRIFMIGLAVLIGVSLWLVMERTRLGAAVCAAGDDAQMAAGGGIGP